METTDLEFIKPSVTRCLDLELRPYSAGTELQLDQMRAALKARLKRLFADNPDESYRKHLSNYYFVGMFLFIHSHPVKEMLSLCFDPDRFFEALFDFLSHYQSADIIAADKTVSGMIDSARSVKNWTVEESPQHPNL